MQLRFDLSVKYLHVYINFVFTYIKKLKRWYKCIFVMILVDLVWRPSKSVSGSIASRANGLFHGQRP